MERPTMLALLEVQLQLELDEQRGVPRLAPRARALQQARASGNQPLPEREKDRRVLPPPRCAPVRLARYKCARGSRASDSPAPLPILPLLLVVVVAVHRSERIHDDPPQPDNDYHYQDDNYGQQPAGHY
jgi:hypothetical protein